MSPMVRGSHGELVEGSDWWLVVYCLLSGVGGWLGEVVERRIAGSSKVSCGLRRHCGILLSGSQLLRVVGHWRNVAEKCLQLRMLGIDVGVGCRWYWVERGDCG